VPQATFIASDAAHGDDDDSDESEHTQALESDSTDHESPGNNDDSGIEKIEAVHKEGARGGEGFQDDFDQENCQKDEIYRF
jgi:hypothetical protein